MADVAIIDVGAMTRAVDRMQELRPVDVPGMTEELDEELHELITKLFGAVGVKGTGSVLTQAYRQRLAIQREFDGIDHMVTVV